MKPPIANLQSIETAETRSPGGRFALLRKHLSRALGHPRDGGVWNGGHPFEVEHAEIPPGKQNFPFHSHAAAWEFYWILSGRGTLRTEMHRREIGEGDFFICLPGEAHQLTAAPETALRYLVIANNPMADLIHYPDSEKWNTKPGRRLFRGQLDYYDGEE